LVHAELRTATVFDAPAPRPPPSFPHSQVAKRELALECNYTYEAAAQQRFRSLVAGDAELSKLFYVPQVGVLAVWGPRGGGLIRPTACVIHRRPL
jgi:hypothetical protein